MSEEGIWSEEFGVLEAKHQVSHEFVKEMNSIINNIRASKRKKHLIIFNVKHSQSRPRLSRNSHLSTQLAKTTDQLQIELIEKTNLERIHSNLNHIVSKSRTQNEFLEQELKFFQKDSETLRNINRLMVREVSALNQKIGYYNQQIDEAWTSRIKKGFKPSETVDKESHKQEKRVSITLKVEEEVRKKPRVTFPEFFVQQCGFSSEDGSSEDETPKEEQNECQPESGTSTEIDMSPVTPPQPQTPPFSKYELKTALSYLTSIYRLPSPTQFSELTREQIAIYTKEQIMSYFQIYFNLDEIEEIIIAKYKEMKENIQHRQEQYLLLEESKKELEQKFQRMEIIDQRHNKRVKLDHIFELKDRYERDTNTIIMIITHLQRVVSRHLRIIESMVRIVQGRSEFQHFKEVFHEIMEGFVSDSVKNRVMKNLNKVEGKHNRDRISYLMLSEDEWGQGDALNIERVRYIIQFYFGKFNSIQDLIKDSKIQLNLSKKELGLSRKNLDTYYIQTPDYYRIDNFRITEKLEKKLWRNMMATTTRIDRKEIEEQREEINKTEIKTQRSLLLSHRDVERVKTARKIRSTVSTENRMRLQKTFGNALMLSNIVKKIGRMNRPLSTFRLSK